VFTEHNYWFVVPIFACHLGAVAGAWAYYLAIEINWSDDAEGEEQVEQKEKIMDGKTGKGRNYLQVIDISIKLVMCALNFSMPTCTSQPRHTNPLRTLATPTPGHTPQMRRSISHYLKILKYRMTPVNRGGKNSIRKVSNDHSFQLQCSCLNKCSRNYKCHPGK
jgi:hypothetical protein